VDEDQLAQILNSLEQNLSEIGLSALVAQERLSAVEGKAEKPTAQEIEELRYSWSRRGTGPQPRLRAEDVRIRPLTPGERLATLLDLVEAAVGGTYAIEMRLRDDLKAAIDTEDAAAWDGRVVFADPPESELAGVTPGEWVLPGREELQLRQQAVREVIVLVNRLREQAQLTRSDWLRSDAPAAGTDVDVEIPGDWS
jgi:PAS domain-containing protein